MNLHVVEPFAEVYEPTAHGVQAVAPLVETYVPAAQGVPWFGVVPRRIVVRPSWQTRLEFSMAALWPADAKLQGR